MSMRPDQSVIKLKIYMYNMDVRRNIEYVPTFTNIEGNIDAYVWKINRARGIFYLSTNAHKPYARGLPVKSQRRTNRKQSSSRQY